MTTSASVSDTSATAAYVNRNREWTPQPGMMPCISIQQPWAETILAGVKSIELRTWATSYRGPIALHAGRELYGRREWGKDEATWNALTLARRFRLVGGPPDWPRGAIVGVANLTDCRRFTVAEWVPLAHLHRSDARWEYRTVGWWLSDVRRLTEPVPFRGALGVFAVPLDRIPLLDLAALNSRGRGAS